MKKSLLILFLSITAYLNSYAQQQVVVNYPNGKTKEKFTVDEKGLKHGMYQSFYENGKINTEIIFQHGLKNGRYSVWFENGRKSDEGSYVEDKRNGLFKSYSEEGKIMEEIYFENGVIKE